MEPQTQEVIKSCAILWISIYLLWLLSGTILSCIWPSLVIVGALLLGVHIFRIPRPSNAVLEAIVGKDLALEENGNGQFVMKVVGHRGACLDAPENSLAAFKYCADKGCHAVEFDLVLTKDEIPIIYHDSTIERLTGVPSAVRDMTWEELSTVDIAAKHPLRDRFLDTRIAKLDETIDLCLKLGLHMFIDCKDGNKKIIKTLLDLFEKNEELYSCAVVSSFDPFFLYKLRRANPRIVCSIAYRSYFFTHESYSAATGVGKKRTNNFLVQWLGSLLGKLWEWVLPTFGYYLVGASIVLLHKDYISGEIVQKWRSRGVRVIAWTVNQPSEKQHLLKNLKIPYMTDTLIGEPSSQNTSKTNIPLN